MCERKRERPEICILGVSRQYRKWGLRCRVEGCRMEECRELTGVRQKVFNQQSGKTCLDFSFVTIMKFVFFYFNKLHYTVNITLFPYSYFSIIIHI